MPGSENSIGPAKRGSYRNESLLGKFNDEYKSSRKYIIIDRISTDPVWKQAKTEKFN